MRDSRASHLRHLSAVAVLVIGWAAATPAGADELIERLEEQAFREAAAMAAPSIVRVETVGGLEVVGEVLTPTGPTTGVVVSEDGDLITSSFNFAGNPTSIIVTTPDGQKHPASIVASDRARMLTLLKIEAENLTPIVAAPKADVRAGQWAIALGRTYDVQFPNLSVGIISAQKRIWGRAIQTDANVSPMNYGGPLVDLQGRALGLIVPLSPQEEGETAGVEWYDSGIGFAIPMEDVYTAVGRLKSGEDLKPGKLGVTFTERGPLAGEPVIDRVRPGSPAFDAGLQAGDRILEADGRGIERLPQFQQVLGQKYAGDRLSLRFSRDEMVNVAEVVLTDELTTFVFPLLGILPVRPDPLRGPAEGVPVRFVLEESPAAAVGIQPDDVIVSVGQAATPDVLTLGDVMSRFRPGEEIEVEFRRGGEQQRVTVSLGSLPGEPPAELPSVSIPAPAELAEPVSTGRWTATLDGETQREYWAYVPEGYHPDYRYGLLVWVHPTGEPMEAALLSRWQTICNRRGLLIVSPRSHDVAGWIPNDVEFVADLVKSMTDRYNIDPQRIVIHAAGDGGNLACLAAFRERELFRGVCLVGAAVTIPPPENDPRYRLQFSLVYDEDEPVRERIEQSAEGLRTLGFGVWTRPLPPGEGEYPARETIEEIGRWIDSLDAI